MPEQSPHGEHNFPARGSMNDPNNWNPEGDSIAVGDPMTEAWLDRFRDLMKAYNEAQVELRQLRSVPGVRQIVTADGGVRVDPCNSQEPSQK